jgi:hypothetical protein
MVRSWRLRRPRRWLGMGLAAAAAATALVAGTGGSAQAVGPYGRDTCLLGYVWRETVPTDHVCVTPAIRAQAQADNAAAASRRYPWGGCRPGYFYRGAAASGEADYEDSVAYAHANGLDPTVYLPAHMNALSTQDRVCVTWGVRSQTAADNAISTFTGRVLVMRMTLNYSSDPVTVEAHGFNAGWGYVAVVRSSDNAVLWASNVATPAGDTFTATTSLHGCNPGQVPTPVYLVGYDYTSGVWNSDTVTKNEVC